MSDKILYIDVCNVEIYFFILNDVYFKEVLKNDVIWESLLNVWRFFIFLVIGVKIVESVIIVMGKKKNIVGEIGLEIDFIVFGIFVDVGVSIKVKRDDYYVMVI